MKRIFTLLTAIIALFVAAYTLNSCTSNKQRHKSIAVSLPPQASLLREITGDSIDIVTLMERDANPEAFEVTINTLRKINDADLYLKIGNLPFEQTLTEKIGDSNKSLRFVDISKGVAPIYGTHSHHGHSHPYHTDNHNLNPYTPDNQDNSGDFHPDDADPHTWTSIANLKVMATNMLEAVNDVDPANKPYYTANYQRLIHRLDSVDTVISSRLADAPSRAFLIWHPSLSYFSRDYGLEQIPLGQDNKEMTPGQIRDMHQRAARQGVKVMFIQQNFDASQAQTIADELGVTVVQINPLDDDYLRQFSIITDALCR